MFICHAIFVVARSANQGRLSGHEESSHLPLIAILYSIPSVIKSGEPSGSMRELADTKKVNLSGVLIWCSPVRTAPPNWSLNRSLTSDPRGRLADGLCRASRKDKTVAAAILWLLKGVIDARTHQSQRDGTISSRARKCPVGILKIVPSAAGARAAKRSAISRLLL